jgi:hypothetical protein
LEQYREWRRHPCTVQLFADITVETLDGLTSDLPSVDPVNAAFEMQGGRKAFETVMNWKPESVAKKTQDGDLDD